MSYFEVVQALLFRGFRNSASAFLVTLCFVAGSGGVAESVEPARDGKPPQPPNALPVRTIAFGELTFVDPVVRARLVKVESVARALAGAEWQHVPWHWHGATGQTPERHFYFATQWGSRPSGQWQCNCSPEQAPCHVINVVAHPRNTEVGRAKDVGSVSVMARHYPKGKGWGVYLSHSENYLDGRWQNEHFYAALDLETWPLGIPPRKIVLPLRGYGVKKRYGNVEYDIYSAPAGSALPSQGARAYLKSPESLRDTALSSLAEIEKAALAQICSGEAIRFVTDYSITFIEKDPGPRNPDPRRGPSPERPRNAEFKPPLPEKYQLSDDQKQEIIREMQVTFASQRRNFQEDYKEMHQALERAFPLSKVLAD